MKSEALKIGIACYPLVGGSGILASALGEELARRGHEAHFFSYAPPVRLDLSKRNVFFHPVIVNEYELFKYAEYTLPLAVRMAEVADHEKLDIIHAHYAVPHATAAYLAKRMVKRDDLRIVTTLHGTDTTLLGRDPNYRPAIEYSLQHSDVVTTVSDSLKKDSDELFDIGHPVQVVPNFFTPKETNRSRAEMRRRLRLEDDFVVLHASNLRPVKRVDLLLEAVSKIRNRDRMKLLVVAAGSFESYHSLIEERGLKDRIIVVGNEYPIENYIEASDVSVYTSETESFCLGILEAMFFGKPSIAFAVGGIPEVVENGVSGLLHPFGDTAAMARSIDDLIGNRKRLEDLGQAARARAERLFTADKVVAQYLKVYQLAMG